VEIVVKGRHTEVTDRFRQHATEKLARIERLDPKVISIDVESSKERNPRLADHSERIELTVRSRGPVVRAEASAPDCYAALDAAYQKLESRLRRAHDRRRVHHGTKRPVSVATATAALDPAGRGPRDDDGPSVTDPGLPHESDAGHRDLEHAQADAGEGVPFIVSREKVHEGKPIAMDQALYEMELVGHDFYLFLDVDTSQPSVVYRRRGYDYGVIRLAL
jgi:ribosomal subunit interface protein